MNIWIGKLTLTYSDLNLVGQDPRALCGGTCPRSQKFARNVSHTAVPWWKWRNLIFQFENSIFKFQTFSRFKFLKDTVTWISKLFVLNSFSRRRAHELARLSVPVYAWDARGIGHADGLDWAPNSVGARCLLRHHVHSAFCRPPIESWSLVAVYRGVTRAVSH